MPADPEAAACLRAYELMQVTQSDARDAAVRDLAALEARARRSGWREAELVAAAGLTMAMLLRSGDGPGAAASDALVARARSLGAPHLVALALSLRAVAAARRDDGEALLADAASALAIVEEESLPALDRCAVLLICAAAYNTLRLWELETELLDRASALAHLCESPVQEPAVAANRVLVRVEWALSLLETDATEAAHDQLELAAEALTGALAVDGMQPLWRLDLTALGDLLRFVLSSRSPADAADGTRDAEEAELATLDVHVAALTAAGDVEVLPLLQALVPYALLCRGRTAAALARLPRDVPASVTTGAASFPLWVRAQVLAAGDRPGVVGEPSPDDPVPALRDYAAAVTRHRWTMREGVLAAARGRIAAASLRIENRMLARDIMLDPLTGIPNRRAFDAWLTAVHPVETAAALVLLDLDRFKQINDAHGHAVGDDVLRAVSRLLVAHVRPGDLALRLGGDEMAVVVQDPPADPAPDPVPGHGLATLAASAGERAEALAAAVAATDWDEVVPGLRVQVSVGVAAGLLGPDLPGAADRLYRAADSELYAAKSRRTRHAG